MNHSTQAEIKNQRIKLFINALLLDSRGYEVNNNWGNWVYEIRLFLTLDEDTLAVYNNIVNENSNLFLPKNTDILAIISGIRELYDGQTPEYEFCRIMWHHLFH